MFSITDRRGLYRLSTGLADARMAVRALSVQITPAFAIDTCSVLRLRVSIRWVARMSWCKSFCLLRNGWSALSALRLKKYVTVH